MKGTSTTPRTEDMQQSEQFPMPEAPRTASPVPSLTSLHATPGRGPYGDARYRGNCSGLLIKDLLSYFRPRSVLDPMQGGGTCRGPRTPRSKSTVDLRQLVRLNRESFRRLARNCHWQLAVCRSPGGGQPASDMTNDAPAVRLGLRTPVDRALDEPRTPRGIIARVRS